jgi:hypothetical protein
VSRPAPGGGRFALVLSLLAAAAPGCSRTREAASATSRPEAAAPAPAAGPPVVAFYAVGRGPRAVAVHDLDGDGRLDAAVANAGDGTVTVLFGDGSGRLGSSTTFAAGREPADLDAADLDRDGDADLVVVNHETPSLTALLNDGQGRFAPAPGSPFDTGAHPHVHGLVSGDLDGDGWLDVAVESADTGTVRVLRGGPDGFSAALSIPVGTMPYSRLGVGDVTGDGRPDVLVPGHADRTVRGVTGGPHGFRLLEWTIRLDRQPWMVVAADIDADGRDDLVVVETDAISIWLAGEAGFARAPGSPVPVRGATEAAVGDVDGDGVAEIAVGPWDGDLVIVLAGKTAAVRRVSLCERPIGLAVADLDGDGRGELLATCALSNRLAVTSVQPQR